jgi:hypothetical protein
MAVIDKTIVNRQPDGKSWSSTFGHAHHGKNCTVLRNLVRDDPDFGKDFDPSIQQTVVQLEDGTIGWVLGDEVKG